MQSRLCALTTGERVKANVLVQLSKTDHTMVQSRSLFAAVIMQVKDDGEKFAIFCFDDESMHDVPASGRDERTDRCTKTNRARPATNGSYVQRSCSRSTRRRPDPKAAWHGKRQSASPPEAGQLGVVL